MLIFAEKIFFRRPEIRFAIGRVEAIHGHAVNTEQQRLKCRIHIFDISNSIYNFGLHAS